MRHPGRLAGFLEEFCDRRFGLFWAVDYCRGPVFSLLWLGVFCVVWDTGRFPRGLSVGWNRD